MQKMWGKSVINSNAQFRSSAVAVAAACSKGPSSSADLSVEVGSCLRLVSNPLVEKDIPKVLVRRNRWMIVIIVRLGRLVG